MTSNDGWELFSRPQECIANICRGTINDVPFGTKSVVDTYGEKALGGKEFSLCGSTLALDLVINPPPCTINARTISSAPNLKFDPILHLPIGIILEYFG